MLCSVLSETSLPLARAKGAASHVETMTGCVFASGVAGF